MKTKRPWNKGYTKFTHPSLMKTSKTFIAKPKNNFYNWQIKNRKKYKPLRKSCNLAELIGVILGDGHIEKFPRTEKTKRNCIRISVYEKHISRRLNIPTGNRSRIKILVPKWILNNKNCIISYLRGLYEAEGNFCVHKPTYTYKFFFDNKNPSLLKIVYRLLKLLKFHPHKSRYRIQISRKNEVYQCKQLLSFRNY